MNVQFTRQIENIHSPTNQLSKKYDLLQKIEKLGEKQKQKPHMLKYPQSPKSPYSYEDSDSLLAFQSRKASKMTKDQNQIITSLKSQLLNIKEDVSKLMGKQKSSSISQSIKSKRIVSSNAYDNESLASENVNMYRYRNRHQGFQARSDSYESYQKSSTINDNMSQVPAINRKRQINLTNKLKTSPRIVTDFSQHQTSQMFKKSPKNSPKNLQTSILSKNYNQQLTQAKNTIKYLQGVIEDSNSIRRGLQSKISSLKKSSISNYQSSHLQQQLSRQKSLRISLQQKIAFLTNEIEILQSHIENNVPDISASNVEYLMNKTKEQRQQINRLKHNNDNRSMQSYEVKIKSLVESHNRQVFGLKTELKLHKLNLQKYIAKQKAYLNKTKQQLPLQPIKLTSKCCDIIKDKLQVQILPQIKDIQILQFGIQTDKEQQAVLQIKEQTVLQIASLSDQSSQTQKMIEFQTLELLKQQVFSLKGLKCQLEVKVAQLQSQNSNVNYQLEQISTKLQSYKQVVAQSQESNQSQQQQLHKQIIELKTKISESEKIVYSNKIILQQALEQKQKLIREKDIRGKDKIKNDVETKVHLQTIKDLSDKNATLNQEKRALEYKYKLQLSDNKAQIQTLNSDYRKLTQLYAQKCKQDQLSKNSSKSIDVQQLERKNQRLQLDNQKLYSQIEELEYKHRTQLSEYKLQLNSTRKSSMNSEIHEKGFDQSLKKHLEQIFELKQQVQEKKQLILQLKQQCRSLRTLADNNRTQLQIEKLKGISERKNMTVAFEVDIQNMKNQLSFEKKALDSISTKLKLLNQQNKRKDEFLQKYILGKNISAEFKVEVTQFFKRYQGQFSVDKLKERVYTETITIDRLMEQNSILVRNVCQMRQQLLAINNLQNKSYDKAQINTNEQNITYDQQSPNNQQSIIQQHDNEIGNLEKLINQKNNHIQKLEQINQISDHNS